MSDKPNLDRLKSAYRTWHETTGSEPDAWLSVFDDEVRMCSMDEAAAGLSFAKDRRSRQEAASYFSAPLADSDMVHWTPETFVCDGDRIAMFGRCAWISKATGKRADVRIAHLSEFRGGKIVGLTEVFGSARAAAAAGP